jgi:hypothetical protein
VLGDAVARHSVIQAGGSGTIDIESISVLHYFVAVVSTVRPGWPKMNEGYSSRRERDEHY